MNNQNQTLRLRSLVLALGETIEPRWWDTEFMSSTGLSFLKRLYPRTAFKAAVHAAGEAACAVHDRAVGKIGVHHLFRLPEQLEMDLYEYVPASDDPFIQQVCDSFRNQEALLAMLMDLSSRDMDLSMIQPGPVSLGSGKDLKSSTALQSVAAYYSAAFSCGLKVYPYFSVE